MRAFDWDDAGIVAVMAERAEDGRPPRAPGRRALRRGARAARRAGIDYELDPRWCAASTTTRARCSSSTSDVLGAQSGIGGGGRYDGLIEQLGGPPTPGVGWAAGLERIAAAPSGEHAEPRRRSRAGVRRASPRRAAARAASSARSELREERDRPPMELGGRSLKAQIRQAERLGAPWVVIVGDEESRSKDAAAGRAGERRRPDEVSPPCCAEDAAVKPRRAPTRYRDAWCGEVRRERVGDDGAGGGLGPPAPGPRRAGVRRPARPHRDRAGRLQPGERARGARAAHELRSEA